MTDFLADADTDMIMSNAAENSVYAHMPDMGFIAIGGSEAIAFLQSIITANVILFEIKMLVLFRKEFRAV